MLWRGGLKEVAAERHQDEGGYYAQWQHVAASEERMLAARGIKACLNGQGFFHRAGSSNWPSRQPAPARSVGVCPNDSGPASEVPLAVGCHERPPSWSGLGAPWVGEKGLAQWADGASA